MQNIQQVSCTFAMYRLLLSLYLFLKKCLRNFIIVNILIKMGAKAGLTLLEIAQLIYLEDEDSKSILNDLASRAAILTKNEQNYIKETKQITSKKWLTPNSKLKRKEQLSNEKEKDSVK